MPGEQSSPLEERERGRCWAQEPLVEEHVSRPEEQRDKSSAPGVQEEHVSQPGEREEQEEHASQPEEREVEEEHASRPEEQEDKSSVSSWAGQCRSSGTW